MSSPSPAMASLSRRTAVLLALLMPVAAADDAPLCRIKIGDDWVTMGAESQASCLKFAQSAALPDERQLSEFGGQQFAYENGRLTTTRDGGATWVVLPADQDAVDPMQSLNVLRNAGHAAAAAPASPLKPTATRVDVVVAAAPSPAVTELAPAASPAAATAKSAPPAASVPTATSTPPASAAATPAAGALATRDAVADTVASTTPQTDVATTAPQVAAKAALASDPDPAPAIVASLLDPVVSRDPAGCQVKTGTDWSTSFTQRLSSCALLLIEAAKQSSATGHHAYWSGHYLFYAQPRLYHSTDSQTWQVVDYQLTSVN